MTLQAMIITEPGPRETDARAVIEEAEDILVRATFDDIVATLTTVRTLTMPGGTQQSIVSSLLERRDASRSPRSELRRTPRTWARSPPN